MSREGSGDINHLASNNNRSIYQTFNENNRTSLDNNNITLNNDDSIELTENNDNNTERDNHNNNRHLTNRNRIRSSQFFKNDDEEEEEDLPISSDNNNNEDFSKTSKSKRIKNVLKRISHCILSNILLIFTLIAVIIGLTVGIILNIVNAKKIKNGEPAIINEITLDFLNLPGDMLLRALNMLIVPLIVSSMISAITSLGDTIRHQEEEEENNNNNQRQQEEEQNDNNRSRRQQQQERKGIFAKLLGRNAKIGKMACITLSYYFTTTLLAAITGITMVSLIQPGYIQIGTNTTTTTTGMTNTMTSGVGGSVNSNNLLISYQYPINYKNNNKAFSYFINDKLLTSSTTSENNNSSSSHKQIIKIIEGFIPSNLFDAASAENGGSVNVLGLIVFSVFFALVMVNIGEKAKPVVKFFESLNTIMLKMVGIVIWYAPIGIMFLLIWRCCKEKDLVTTVGQLGFYMLTVFAGLAFHAFVTIPIIYLILVRKNIFKYVFHLAPALLTALGTSSSNATLPLTLRQLNSFGINKKISSFVIPLGSTVNMDGTCVYEAVAAIFISQSLGYTLGFGDMIVVAITATLASIGAAGIPEAGLVTLLLVTESIGLPKESVSLILAVDWFLDRFRTVVNVYGDTIGTAIVDKYVSFEEKEETKEIGKSPSTVKLLDKEEA
ncbi:hypothetical protein ABK040_005844 [Willaertia magna]